MEKWGLDLNFQSGILAVGDEKFSLYSSLVKKVKMADVYAMRFIFILQLLLLLY